MAKVVSATCTISSRRLAGLVGVEVPPTPGRKDSQQGPLLFSTHFPSASESPLLPLLGTFWLVGEAVVTPPIAPPPSFPAFWLRSRPGPRVIRTSRGRLEVPFCKDGSSEELVTAQPLTRNGPHTLQSLSSFLQSGSPALQKQSRLQGQAGVACWAQPGCAEQEVDRKSVV